MNTIFFHCNSGLKAKIVLVVASIMCGCSAAQISQPAKSEFACGGELEAKVWKKWDESGRAYAEEILIGKRLIQQGDTYSLYDFENYFHNLLSMAQRCKRIERVRQFADLVNLAYGQLVPESGENKGLIWICRGGAICNKKNKLIDKEVQLNSLQFLAFAADVALDVSRDSSSPRDADFVAKTILVLREQIVRWSAIDRQTELKRRLGSRSSDVNDRSSSLFLSERDLWQAAIYSSLAGMIYKNRKLSEVLNLDEGDFSAAKQHLSLLLRLIDARTEREVVSGPGGGRVALADIDSGFWKNYSDNMFSGYSGKEKPVSCISGSRNPSVKSNLNFNKPTQASNVGWDFSHARRFVHYFEAIDQNRLALKEVFAIPTEKFSSQEDIYAFAQSVRLRIWNKNEEWPLFSNYFSGVNGWYRVAYDNKSGQCFEGYPPFGLSISFPTGGYITWGEKLPILKNLGERIYKISQSNEEAEILFMNKYYSKLARQAKTSDRLISELMFWPTLIN